MNSPHPVALPSSSGQAMQLPKERGELSGVLFETLRGGNDTWDRVHQIPADDADDEQVALWALYELHYRGFDDVDAALEWDPDALRVRRRLEVDFEARLRARQDRHLGPGNFSEALFAFIDDHEGPSLAAFVQRRADREQALELLRHRSVYHLKEADPTTWVVPRLTVVPKAALSELQYDEYGAGNPNRLHSHLFARGMAACGLEPRYGAYIDEVPVEVLEQNNAMSLFGLHRRLRGAALGHLAAFEVTSSQPSRRLATGLQRLGLAEEMVAYYEEHVEADAVHDQLAVRAICAPLVEEDPGLVADVAFGAFTALELEARYATRMLEVWGLEPR